MFSLFLGSRKAQAEEGPDPRSHTFKETRHVGIFTVLGKSSQTSLCQGLNFLVGTARTGGRMVDGVEVSLPPGSLSQTLVLLQIVRKKERDI